MQIIGNEIPNTINIQYTPTKITNTINIQYTPTKITNESSIILQCSGISGKWSGVVETNTKLYKVCKMITFQYVYTYINSFCIKKQSTFLCLVSTGTTSTECELHIMLFAVAGIAPPVIREHKNDFARLDNNFSEICNDLAYGKKYLNVFFHSFLFCMFLRHGRLICIHNRPSSVLPVIKYHVHIWIKSALMKKCKF